MAWVTLALGLTTSMVDLFCSGLFYVSVLCSLAVAAAAFMPSRFIGGLYTSCF